MNRLIWNFLQNFNDNEALSILPLPKRDYAGDSITNTCANIPMLLIALLKACQGFADN